MSSVKTHLKAARDALAKKNYREALVCCRSALKVDKQCYDAWTYVGKAAFHLGETEQAESAYHKATKIEEDNPTAWQGLALLYSGTEQWPKAVEAYQNLVDLSHRSSDPALKGKILQFSKSLAEVQVKSEDYEAAEQTLKELMSTPELDLPEDQHLECLCLLADVQLREDELELEKRIKQKIEEVQKAGGVAPEVNAELITAQVQAAFAFESLELQADHASLTLKEIVTRTPPGPRFAPYHDAYLLRLRRAIQVAPPGSMDRHVRRVAVLQQACVTMQGKVAGKCTGCVSPYAFRVALRMLEVEEEVCGASVKCNSLMGSGTITPVGYTPMLSLSREGSGINTPIVPMSPHMRHSALMMNSSSPRLGRALSISAAATPMSPKVSQGPFQGPLNYPAAPPASLQNPFGSHPPPLGISFGQPSPIDSNMPPSPLVSHLSRGHSFGRGQVPFSNISSQLPSVLTSQIPSAVTSPKGEGADVEVLHPHEMHPGVITAGGSVTALPLMLHDTEYIAQRLAHAFPWDPMAAVHLAMAIHRRESYMATRAGSLKKSVQNMATTVTDLSLEQPVVLQKLSEEERRQILIKQLSRGVQRGAQSVAAYIALAEMLLHNGDAKGALEAAKQGVKVVFDWSKAGKEKLRHAALMLNLLAAQAMVKVGQLEDAARIFYRLSQRVSEGEVSFGVLAGLPPTSIRQQATRGLAQVALLKGDRSQAEHHYESLVAKALLGRGHVEHWAYAEYGWMLFEDGNLEAARVNLETALEELERCDEPGVGKIRADYCYKLGRIFWELDGDYRSNSDYAQAHFLEAVTKSGDDAQLQASALAWLGKCFQGQGGDEARAKRCFQRALLLDPNLDVAGEWLCELLSNEPAMEKALCDEVLSREPNAQWALKRLASLQVEGGTYEDAVRHYQKAIRQDPEDPSLWEGMGTAYQALGKQTSALKSLTRSLQLDPQRPYALMQVAALHYQLGSFSEAIATYKEALKLETSHPAALLGLAETYLASAHLHARMGAFGVASADLEEAADAARKCTMASGNVVTAWKLLGDIKMQHGVVIPLAHEDKSGQQSVGNTPGSAGWVETAGQQLQAQLSAVRHARRAYLHALHLAPVSASLWGDVAAALQQEREVIRKLRAFEEMQGPVAFPEDLPSRLVRGGLRLQPDSEWLWQTLGLVVETKEDQGRASAAVREYAWARALQLNPKNAVTWALLGRMYTNNGEGDLASRCLEQARSCAPTLVAVWEAMGHEAGVRSRGRNAHKVQGDVHDDDDEALACWEHAVELGGSLESWLGFAAGYLHRDQVDDATVLACASRAVNQRPDLPAAHNALALALEHHGAYDLAAAGLGRTLDLLDTVDPEVDGSVATTLVGPGLSTNNMRQAVTLNLARVMCKAGRFEEAVQLYRHAQEGFLAKDLQAQLSLSHALFQLGDSLQCKTLLRRIVEQEEGDSKVAAASALLYVLLFEGDLEGALELMLGQGLAMGACQTGLEECGRMWIRLLAGCQLQNHSNMEEQVQSIIDQWLTSVAKEDWDQAGFKAELWALKSVTYMRKGDVADGIKWGAKAVHLAPWSVPLRVNLASRALHHEGAYSGYLCGVCPKEALAPSEEFSLGRRQHRRPLVIKTSHLWGHEWRDPNTVEDLYLKGSVIRASASLSQSALLSLDGGLEEELSNLQRLAHARPWDPFNMSLLAYISLQWAQARGEARLYCCTLRYCKMALELCKRQVIYWQETAQLTGPGTEGRQPGMLDTPQWKSSQEQSKLAVEMGSLLRSINLRLKVTLSEAYLHSKVVDWSKLAYEAALDSLHYGVSAGINNFLAHRQLARVLAVRCKLQVNDGQDQEQSRKLEERVTLAYLEAIRSGDALAVLEYSRWLMTLGRSKEALDLLKATWSKGNEGEGKLSGAGYGTREADLNPMERLLEKMDDNLKDQLQPAGLLEQAIALAKVGDVQAAKTLAEVAADLCETRCLPPSTPQLLRAEFALKLNKTGVEGPKGNLLLEARWAANQVSRETPLVSQEAGIHTSQASTKVLANSLLGEVELLRNKGELGRQAVERALTACRGLCPKPAFLLYQYGQMTGSRSMCAHAVHLEPWRTEAWKGALALPA